MKPLTPIATPLSSHSPAALKPEQNAVATKREEKAAAQFETMLMLQMVKEVTKTLENSSLFGTMPGASVYSGMADWQLAELLSQSAETGLKDAILRELQSKEKENHVSKSH